MIGRDRDLPSVFIYTFTTLVFLPHTLIIIHYNNMYSITSGSAAGGSVSDRAASPSLLGTLVVPAATGLLGTCTLWWPGQPGERAWYMLVIMSLPFYYSCLSSNTTCNGMRFWMWVFPVNAQPLHYIGYGKAARNGFKRLTFKLEYYMCWSAARSLTVHHRDAKWG